MDNKKRLLIKLAQKELQAISFLYRWKEMRCIDLKQEYSFFARKKAEKELYKCIKEIYMIQDQLSEIAGSQQGRAWWEVKYNDYVKHMLHNLPRNINTNKERYEYQWQISEGTEQRICLQEEVHISSFNTRTYENKEIISAYSEYERDRIVQEEKDKDNRRIAKEVFWDDGSMVRSLDTGHIYDSKEDYYKSLEYQTLRDTELKKIENSLYTEKRSNKVYSSSNSMHYKIYVDAGKISIDSEHNLQNIQFNPTCLVKSNVSEVDAKNVQRLNNVDPVVLCGAFIHDSNQVLSVNSEILDCYFSHPMPTETDALRIACFFVSIADKII